MIFPDDAIPMSELDTALAAEVDRVLEKHYPGHPWAITNGPGVLYIMNPALSATHGIKLNMGGNLASAGFLERAVVRHAGEFLERHNVPRAGRADPGHLAELARQARFN